MILREKLVKAFVEGRAVPVHTVIDCIFDGRMPIGLGKRVGVTNYIAD